MWIIFLLTYLLSLLLQCKLLFVCFFLAGFFWFCTVGWTIISSVINKVFWLWFETRIWFNSGKLKFYHILWPFLDQTINERIRSSCNNSKNPSWTQPKDSAHTHAHSGGLNWEDFLLRETFYFLLPDYPDCFHLCLIPLLFVGPNQFRMHE